MRSKWFKTFLALALAVGVLCAPRAGEGAATYNRSQLNSLFNQAYGNCNQLRSMGYNPSQIESRLRWAQQQLNNYWANPTGGFSNFPRTPYDNKELQTINPFGDYLFDGVKIRSHGGKLQTRSMDPMGLVARAQDWAKQLHSITQKAESGGGSGAFNQNVKDALAFLGGGSGPLAAGSLGQQASSQIGALSGSLGGGANSGLRDSPISQGQGGQFQNPFAGDSSVVDLRGSKTLTPSLLRGPNDPPDTPPGQASSKSAPLPSELREAIASDPKAKQLHDNLVMLEAEKSRLTEQSAATRDGALADMSKFELLPGSEGRAERMKALFPEAGKDAAEEVAFSKYALANEAVLGEMAKPVKLLWTAKDWAAHPWFEHNWYENVDFAIEHQPVLAVEWSYRTAKAYTGLSPERYQDYQAAEGRTAMRLEFQKYAKQDMQKIMEMIKKNRQELSRTTGVPEDQLAAYYRNLK